MGVTGGLIALAAALAVATAVGVVLRLRSGRFRGGAAGPRSGAGTQRSVSLDVLTEADLGSTLGEQATLLQFSTAFCAPCRATRRILSEVAGMIEGVSHVEIDAESRLDLVRRLDIRRTPTVLVVGPDGRIAKRASGQPRKADVIAAVGDVS